MTTRKYALCLATLVASPLLTAHAQASDFTLDFASLPTAQGWSFVTDPTNPRSESDIFSLSSGVLTQDSIGDGDGRFLYQYSSNIDWTQPFSVSVRSRLLADAGGASRRLGAFGFYAFAGANAYGVIFRPGIVQNYAENVISTAIDTSSFHDYLLEVNPATGYRFYVDGIQVSSGLGVNRAAGPNSVSFGDGTLVVEARAEVTGFRILQAVPEPSTYALALAGGVFVYVAARRRERKVPQ